MVPSQAWAFGEDHMKPNATEDGSLMMNEHQVAETLCISVASLRRWRLLARGPLYRKLGTSVRYRRNDVEAWLASRPTGGERKLEHSPNG
jgi:predicted DNA-binding transcriptional regulator AlpA